MEADALAKAALAGGAMDECDRVPIHAEHRYSRGTANWRRRKLDDSNSPLSQGQKASRG